MRLSDLSGKEVINISDGARLGVIDQCEVVFDSQSGNVEAILLPNRTGLFNFFSNNRISSIPWGAIKRIGDEVIIVDLNYSFERMHSGFRRRRHENTY